MSSIGVQASSLSSFRENFETVKTLKNKRFRFRLKTVKNLPAALIFAHFSAHFFKFAFSYSNFWRNFIGARFEVSSFSILEIWHPYTLRDNQKT
jgi:hypothetical protein